MSPRAALPGPRIGWPLFCLPDQNGQLQWPTLEESVRQMLQVILLTRPGEQLMHPEFGAGLQLYVADANTLATRRRIQERIVGCVTRWEPRIVLDRVEVGDDPEEPTVVRVEIAYRLRRTGAAQVLRASLNVGS